MNSDIIGGIIIILCFLGFIIWDISRRSDKETKKERIADAVGQFAHESADKIADIATRITEPESKKDKREAITALLFRLQNILSFKYGDNKSGRQHLDSFFAIDDSIRKSLQILSISDNQWDVLTMRIYYIGLIFRSSRDISDYSKKKSKQERNSIITEWGESKHLELQEHREVLLTALSYFNISDDNWIEYGDSVIQMYNLCDSPDMGDFIILFDSFKVAYKK